MVESLHIEIQKEEQYLIAHVSGALSLDNLKELVDIVETESKKRGYNLFLVDMLRTGPPEKEMDRFYIGEYVALKLRGLKVAAVYPQELITKFGENTAVNRGASLIVLGDREQAIKWLLEGQPTRQIQVTLNAHLICNARWPIRFERLTHGKNTTNGL